VKFLKHKPVRVSSFYEIKEGKVERKKKVCPRCGEGTFMADHGDRWYCGKCKLTIWKKKD